MAYNMSDEELLNKMVTEPTYCMFYYRNRVTQLLPRLAEAYLLIGKLQKELKKTNENEAETVLRMSRPKYSLEND